MPLFKKEKNIACVCDNNYARSEVLSLLGIKFSIADCKNLWADLCKLEYKCTDQDGQSHFNKVAMRLDFTMTFYQLNCLMVDNFHDPDYFARNSKMDIIIDNKPSTLTLSSMSEL